MLVYDEWGLYKPSKKTKTKLPKKYFTCVSTKKVSNPLYKLTKKLCKK